MEDKMTYRVLLVEDDKMVQAINRDYVNRSGKFHVEKIVSSYEAAERILHKESFDLVLIDDDLGAGKRQGRDLFDKIQQLQPGCQMIMLTAQDSVEVIKEGLRCGVHDYILKPFSYERLYSSLESLDRKLLLLFRDQKLNQKDLDLIYLSNSRFHSSSEDSDWKKILIEGPLEKGITSATLEKVLEAINQFSGAFTIIELVNKIHISHVTVRKYIHFLIQKKYLKTYQEYGHAGRPVIYYSKR